MKYVYRSFLLIGLISSSACGINIRTAMESDMRFEHCYRIDEDKQISNEEKRYCWRNWTATYVHRHNQPRVIYAQKRIRALESTNLIDTQKASASPSSTKIAVSSPYAPPPITTTANTRLRLQPSNSTCNEQCNHIQASCAQICLVTAQCLAQCQARFQSCLNRCL